MSALAPALGFRPVETAGLRGMRWLDNGQSILSGPLLELYERLDQLFLGWARAWGAADYRFPALIAARELNKVGYFSSFPHLATFPVCLRAEAANLEAFARGEPWGPESGLRLTETGPVHEVLTPAACYHAYALLQGERLPRPVYLTTRNTCFRRESQYLPLQRQWSFSMREIICLGTGDEVRLFLTRLRSWLDAFVAACGLPVTWQQATDPFFDPAHDPKHLAQRLEPVKTEMVLPNGLAIGSINCHYETFGKAFGIRREAAEASSGCVAFGIERWIFAVLSSFGPDPRRWPAAFGGARD